MWRENLSFHQLGEICSGCNKLLEMCHPEMEKFFMWAKSFNEDLHISEGWRSQEDQAKDFDEGRSELKWPMSKHNFTMNGYPYSLALDLFQMDEHMRTKYDHNFYEQLYNEALEAGFSIRWGGSFKSLQDSDHFELIISNQFDA